MSFDKQIQDKFSGFEPEVPEEQIDAGWKKISYFLPAEEKKKRGFFFYRSMKGMAVALSIGLMAGLTFLLMTRQEKTKAVSALPHTRPVPQAAAVNNSETQHPFLTRAFEQHPGAETVPANASSLAAKRIYQTPSVPHPFPSSSIAKLNGCTFSSGKKPGNTAQATEAKLLTNNNDRSLSNSFYHAQAGKSTNTGAATDPKAARQPYSEGSNELMILLKQNALDGTTPSAPEPEMALLGNSRIDPQLPDKRRPAIELFSGLSHRSLVYKTEQTKRTVQANGFSAGLAGIFPITSKLYFSGQFIVCYHPVKFHAETQATEIIKREVVPPVVSSLSAPADTLIYYKPYQSTFEMQSSTVYNLAGGAGYQLLSKGRISLDGALLLNLRWTRLNYRISRADSDAGIFVNNTLTTNAASFYESVEKQVAPEQASGKKQIIAFGLNPSLSLVYQLSKRTALIFRPAYLLQIMPNSLHVNAKTYRLHENNWYLNLGVRYRL